MFSHAGELLICFRIRGDIYTAVSGHVECVALLSRIGK